MLARQLRHSGKRVGVYKPVASGCHIENGSLVSADAAELWHAAGCPLDLQAVCPQRFLAPLAPHRAADAEGRRVDTELLLAGARRWFGHCDELIVEGAGGLMSPIADGLLNIDYARSLSPVQVVIVVANRLGAIHQALATIAAAKHQGCQPVGIVLCEADVAGSSIGHNAEEIAKYTDVPLIAELGHGESKELAIERCRG